MQTIYNQTSTEKQRDQVYVLNKAGLIPYHLLKSVGRRLLTILKELK